MGQPQRHPLWADARWLLLISGIFSLSVALSNTFVNIYLWKVDKSYIPIGWYNLAVYALVPFAFVVASYIANRYYAVATLRIGVLLHAGFYLFALFGGTRAASVPFLLGMVMGAAQGFYWYSFNFLSLRVTKSETRDRFYGLNGAMVAIANMAAPILSGAIISGEDKFGPLNGYHVIFGVSLILFLVATVVSIKLKPQPISGRLSISQGLRLMKKRPWRHILTGCYIYGLREGVFLFLIGLLMYIATGSELRLGEFLFLQNFLSFLSFYLVGKIVRPGNRVRVLGVGALGMALAALIFLRPVSAAMIIAYGVSIAVALPVFIVPLQGLVFDTISRLDETGDQNDEQLIAREVAENGGRVTGIGVFLLVISSSPTSLTISRLAVVLGFVQLITWFVIAMGHRTHHGGSKQSGKVRWEAQNGALETGGRQSQP
ncbi:MFS transporter [Alicyclobacillus sp. SO9]|uniref:MFS transporter n=1 Tax=Alicyclobacillus sp. SO9 TaxID=2665646 RepID=UPI0018E8D8ED|nr:MFS transporter [Alicyclobacillus sp. SO9]QQE80347.1 MFS transporter [Alicyclobacillus sp. SO9]